MCVLSRGALLAVAGVMMMSAPMASASAPIDVVEGSTGLACPALPAGCEFHAEGEMTLTTHPFGIETDEARCHVEIEGRLQGNEGRIDSKTGTPGGHDASCNPGTLAPCSGSLPWDGSGEEDSPGVVGMHFTMCIDPAEWETCAGEFAVSINEEDVEGTEQQHLVAMDRRIGATLCEVTLDAEVEIDAAHPELHVRHEDC